MIVTIMDNRPTNVTDYYIHNDIFVPDDLQAGDVIQCTMLTLIPEENTRDMCSRSVLVLGFQMNPDTLEYTGVHVARFSRNRLYCTDDTNFPVTHGMLRRGLIRGVDVPSVIKADRVDLIPLDFDHFPEGVISRTGRVYPELFPDIREALQRGDRNAPLSRSFYPKANPRESFLPGMNLPEKEWISLHPHLEFSSPVTVDVDEQYRIGGSVVTKWMVDEERKIALYRRYCMWLSLQHKRKMDAFLMGANHRDDFMKCDPFDPDAEYGLPDEAEPEIILPDDELTYNTSELNAHRRSDVEELAQHFNSGAGTGMRVALPKNLWRGRYVHMKVSSLLGGTEGDAKENIYRPCVVWKAFADKETGELAGLELHPVTRSAGNRFRYKFQVYPLPTRSDKPSFLVADCIVRVPLSDRYFHSTIGKKFFELPPAKLEKFEKKRDIALQSGDSLHVVGLREIPENWVEVALDAVPSFRQFQRWEARGQISFDGHINEAKKAKQLHRHSRPS